MTDISSIQLRRLDSSQLVVFLELMRHRKLTVVAERLGLTQSAISHALKRLRATFGDELFLRLAAGVEPTARAKALEPRVEEIVRLSRDLLQAERPFDPAAESRVIRIGALDFEVALFAPVLVKALRRDAPGIRVSFRNVVRQRALEELAASEIDLAIGFFRDLPDAFESEALFEESYLVVMRKGHPLARRTLTLKSYCDAEHLIVSVDGDLRGIVDQTLERADKARRVAASVPMFFPALSSVQASDLIATIPARLARAHAARFGLAAVAPPLAIRSFPVSAVWHRRTASDGAVTWIREILKDSHPS